MEYGVECVHGDIIRAPLELMLAQTVVLVSPVREFLLQVSQIARCRHGLLVFMERQGERLTRGLQVTVLVSAAPPILLVTSYDVFAILGLRGRGFI